MADNDFNAFISRLKSEEKAHREIDWNRRRELWVEELSLLYKRLVEFLEPYVTEKSIAVVRDGAPLSEEYVGTYVAPLLKIRIGERELFVLPRGMNVIGARGRVDIVGPGSTFKLVLVPMNDDPQQLSWKFVQGSQVPELVDLTKDRFLSALMLAADA